MNRPDLSRLHWRKSSRSGGGQNSSCVEVAGVHAVHLIAARDSKNPTGPVLAFTREEWRNFLQAVKHRL
jgi:hypothetical protein